MTMREILFRGKSVDNGEWIEGVPYGEYMICGMNLLRADDEIPMSEYPEFDYIRIIPETVGQFTGLTDKNGKRIFEGDIVHAIYKSNYGGLKDTDFGNGVIEYYGNYYSGARWEMNIIGETGCRVFSASVECEVIGNIHDNPELPKKQ